MSENSPLGEDSEYPDSYDPRLLFPVARSDSRAALGLSSELPFHGVDIWNAWELTWLGGNGQPQVATAEIRVPASSPSIVESKSLKLYLNSFSMTRLDGIAELRNRLTEDLGALLQAEVDIRLSTPGDAGMARVQALPGECIDTANVRCDNYAVNAALLAADAGNSVDESLHSHLLRSLCPVTGQPDIGSVGINYRGPRIDRDGLLRYIVSYRTHDDFHESCVERMFLDIWQRCSPETLTVYARYQRRGGIDINPYRSSEPGEAVNLRLWRQ